MPQKGIPAIISIINYVTWIVCFQNFIILYNQYISVNEQKILKYKIRFLYRPMSTRTWLLGARSMSPMPPPFLRPWFNVVTMHMINESQALSFRSPSESTITEDFVKLLLPSLHRSSPIDDAEQVCVFSSLLLPSKIKTHRYNGIT